MSIVTVNGIHLHYDCYGSGEPLLLLHGLGSSGRDWVLQVEHFAQHYEVITVDIRGHGRSDKPAGPYSVPLFASDIAQLLEQLEIQQAHVVGLSMGGMIAFQLATDWPELVRSLTIVNSVPEVIIRSFRDRLILWERLFIIHLLGMRRLGKFLVGRLFPDPEQELLRKQFVERWAENDKRAYIDAMKGFVGWSVTQQLPQINCPTLVITADQDYTPVSTKQAYADLIPSAELVVIPNSHHALPVERPEPFNTTLHQFLEQIIIQRPVYENKDLSHKWPDKQVVLESDQFINGVERLRD